MESIMKNTEFCFGDKCTTEKKIEKFFNIGVIRQIMFFNDQSKQFLTIFPRPEI